MKNLVALPLSILLVEISVMSKGREEKEGEQLISFYLKVTKASSDLKFSTVL